MKEDELYEWEMGSIKRLGYLGKEQGKKGGLWAYDEKGEGL